MLNNGRYKIDNIPVYQFETSAHKIKAPEKNLNALGFVKLQILNVSDSVDK